MVKQDGVPWFHLITQETARLIVAYAFPWRYLGMSKLIDTEGHVHAFHDPWKRLSFDQPMCCHRCARQRLSTSSPLAALEKKRNPKHKNNPFCPFVLPCSGEYDDRQLLSSLV